MLPDQSPLGRALGDLQDALRPYHDMQTWVAALVDGWQQLDPDARRIVGGIAPKMTQAVIELEHRAKRLVDA